MTRRSLSGAEENEISGDGTVGRPASCKVAIKDLLTGNSPRQGRIAAEIQNGAS
jgi:hypothetical protein